MKKEGLDVEARMKEIWEKRSIRLVWKLLWKNIENDGRMWKTTAGLFERSISGANGDRKREAKAG